MSLNSSSSITRTSCRAWNIDDIAVGDDHAGLPGRACAVAQQGRPPCPKACPGTAAAPGQHTRARCTHLAAWDVLLHLAQQHRAALALLPRQRHVGQPEDGADQAAHRQRSVAAGRQAGGQEKGGDGGWAAARVEERGQEHETHRG